MRSRLPISTAVMKLWVGGMPAAGRHLKPARDSTSATRRPPFRASPTIWGARNSPTAAKGQVAAYVSMVQQATVQA